MFVCVCRAVSDRAVRAAIEEGATTVRAVTQACCAGDDCGACHEQIEEMIADRWASSAACAGPASERASVRLRVLNGRVGA
jgi:bacterioferritin-associated ferredoxin